MRSSTSSRSASTSRWRVHRRRNRLGDHQGPGHRDRRRRAFPAARICGLVPRRKDSRARRASRSVLLVDDSPFFRNMLVPVLQAAGYAGHAGRGRRTKRLALFRAGALRCRRHRYRDAGAWTASRSPRSVRAEPRTARAPDHRPVVDCVRRRRSSAAARAGFHDYRRQVRPAGPDRRAQGTDRRT